jgi:hypothetical protein
MVVMLLIAGCEYQEPLAEKQNIPIDESVLGFWDAVPDGTDPSPVKDRILVLKLSGTEYLIHYWTGSGSMYFRAYPIRVGDVSCLQLQLLGYSEATMRKDEPPYQVAKYTLSGDEIGIQMLNTSIVSPKLGSSAEIRTVFIKNGADENLFREPGRFKRAKKP